MQNAQLNGKRDIDPMNVNFGSAITSDAAKDERSLSVKDLFAVIWRRLWVVMLVATVLTGIAVGISLAQTPTYSASIKILVGQKPEDDTNTSLAGDVSGLQQLTQTMTQAVDTRPVAEAVTQRLDLQESPEQLLANITTQQIGATQFIEVSYRDASPEEAQKVANTIGEVFSEQVSEVSASTSSITATVWERSVVPSTPVSPEPVRDGLVALVFGLLLGLGLAFLLEHLDDRWRSPEEVEQISGVPTFGVVPAFKVVNSKKRGEKRGGKT